MKKNIKGQVNKLILVHSIVSFCLKYWGLAETNEYAFEKGKKKKKFYHTLV